MKSEPVHADTVKTLRDRAGQHIGSGSACLQGESIRPHQIAECRPRHRTRLFAAQKTPVVVRVAVGLWCDRPLDQTLAPSLSLRIWQMVNGHRETGCGPLKRRSA